MDRRTLLMSAAAACVAARTAPAATGNAQGTKALNVLFDQFMKENLDLSPMTTTSLGLDTGERAREKSLVDDLSVAGLRLQKALTASQLSRLRQFDRHSLDREAAISLDVILYGLQTGDAANRAFDYGAPGAGAPYILNQSNSGFLVISSMLYSDHQILDKADADAYLERLNGFATALDQEIGSARHDLALGIVPPDFIVARTLEGLRRLRAPAADQSPLARSLLDRVRDRRIPGDYVQPAARVIRDRLYPALDRQIALLEQIRRSAPHEAGVWRLPKGEEYYAASLVNYTTTDRSAADIHHQGLEIVREHGARLEELMRSQGLTQGTVTERIAALYKDPRFLYPNTDAGRAALLADLNHRVSSIWSKLPHWFGTLPKSMVEIRRQPRERESGESQGYYTQPSLDGKRPGIYWINLRDTAEMPKWFVPTLTYHESIPGHHLQGSIQQEAGLPLIRKVASFDAYIEGWALYAEQLAGEMGEYDADPLGHLGQLRMSMMRGVRMVVDSGIHAMKWSRERAIGYFREVMGDQEATAVTEVERYCIVPGQACSYMLGKLEFLAARERARKAQGANFDIRRYHDSVLLPGALPLDMLRRI